MGSIILVSCWSLLVIFVAAGVVSLLGLVGVLNIREPYLKWLVRLLILQVVATVIAFGGQSFKAILNQATFTEERLLKSEWAWGFTSEDRKQRWYTTGKFARADTGEISFTATTRNGRDGAIEMIRWRSVTPIEIPFDPLEPIRFTAEQEFTAEAAAVERWMGSMVGHPRKIEMTIQPDLGLRGHWVADGFPAAGMLWYRQWGT